LGLSLSSTAKVAAVTQACREVCAAVGSWHQERALLAFDARQTEEVQQAEAAATAACAAPGIGSISSRSSSRGTNINAREEAAAERALCALKARSKGQLAADDMLPALQLLLVFGAVTEPNGGALRRLGAEGKHASLFPIFRVATTNAR
jgi:hypothetical protein